MHIYIYMYVYIFICICIYLYVFVCIYTYGQVLTCYMWGGVLNTLVTYLFSAICRGYSPLLAWIRLVGDFSRILPWDKSPLKTIPWGIFLELFQASNKEV